MPKHRRKRRSPKRALALPDLEQAKSAVVNSLTSNSGQRTYDHAINEFVGWYCSEPRLAFNRTVVLRYRIHLEQRHLRADNDQSPLAAVRRVAYEAADSGLLSPELAAGIRRVKAYAASACDWATGSLPIRAAAAAELPAKSPEQTQLCDPRAADWLRPAAR